ncbi:MAG: cysteine--tRNA ligase [Microthrixaceae bacterium]|nr:cysteine--tRNA ligase [Microthrixaceae bacterium]
MPVVTPVLFVPMMRLFDTASREVRPLRQRTEGQVSMYVCGPTVYGPPHLGHGRFALVFDILRRYLIWSGLDVTYVSNITDIDDKIINLAEAEGRHWSEVTDQWERVWYDAIDAIGVMRPDKDPHATTYVEQMIDLISDLIDKGAAYQSNDGIYMSVQSVESYGLLIHQDLDQLLAGGGERELVGQQKRHPSDFALWKFVKPGEPSWPSPWGDGRPGWHTECVVMSLDLLGEGFDIHGGGQDLAFPHHENERAQALADGKEFANHWVHNGFVEVAGEKMSKSLGNFTTLVDLIERHDPRSYRLLVLGSHYRSPVEVTESTITAAENALHRLDALGRRLTALGPAVVAVEPDRDALQAFGDSMDDDLDTPAVSAQIFGLVSRINRLLDDGDVDSAAPQAGALLQILGAVGLTLNTETVEVPEAVTSLASQRDEARANKDWALADQLRDEITAAGWSVEDSPDGPVLRPI